MMNDERSEADTIRAVGILKEVGARLHQELDGPMARGGSSVAEHQPSKLVVAGSNPVPRSPSTPRLSGFAGKGSSLRTGPSSLRSRSGPQAAGKRHARAQKRPSGVAEFVPGTRSRRETGAVARRRPVKNPSTLFWRSGKKSRF